MSVDDPSWGMPVRTGDLLPAVYLEDEVSQAFAAAIDSMFGPMLAVLDCLPAYVDPELAPDVWVPRLAAWVAADEYMGVSMALLRPAIGQAIATHQSRGTLGALRSEISAVLGVTPELEENGAGTWSNSPDADLPGTPEPFLRIRLPIPEDTSLNHRNLAAILDRHRPAHVPVRLEVVPEG